MVIAIFCDHPLLDEYRGAYLDTSFIAATTEAEMVKLLDQQEWEKDRKTRNRPNLSASTRRDLRFVDFIEVFGREAKNGDPVDACVQVLVPPLQEY